jgi:hypothetical protein
VRTDSATETGVSERTNGHDDAATQATTDPLRERLAELDVATMTPIEAMTELAELQDELDGE